MDEEELCAGPEGVLLADGAASFLLSWLELADEVSGVAYMFVFAGTGILNAIVANILPEC